MKFSFKCAIFSSFMVFATFVHADALLKVGDNTTVLKIDGQSVGDLFSFGNQKFNLSAGKHIVEARYERIFDISKEDHDTVKSATVALPVNLQDGQTYLLDMINQPKKHHQAQKYAEQPTLALMQNGTVLNKQQGIKGETAGGMLSGLFNSDEPKTTRKPAEVKQTETDAKQKNNTTLDKFMQLWLSATPAERQKIKAWVSEK